MLKMIKSLIVQQKGNGTLGREEAGMAELAQQRGVPVLRASEKQLERKKLIVGDGMVAVGSVPFVQYALRQLGVDLPAHMPYPPVLACLLHRHVQRLSSLREAKVLLDKGQRLFIKPADGWKRFTGFIAEFGDDYRFNGVSNSAAVWISKPVSFLSEWRAYVVNGKVMDVKFADHGGDSTVLPDRRIIDGAIEKLRTDPECPAGFVIDFGVLNTGETALVEMNDGFSFGAYEGISMETYWDVVVARWQQLVSQTEKK